MPASIPLTHAPIIGKNGKLIGNRLTLHVAAGAQADDLLPSLQAIEEHWPMGNLGMFLQFAAEGEARALPGAGFFDWMVPENAVVELASGALVADAALVEAARNAGCSVGLDLALATAGGALQTGLNFRFTLVEAASLPAAQWPLLLGKLPKSAGHPILAGVNTAEQFKQAGAAGFAGAAGWFCKAPMQAHAKELAPGQAHIIRILNLLRNNADVAQIEAALKQDVALSYRLLRYINSAGFGLSTEVQSFRHAVTILGYDKLNKWLSLLLVSSSKDPLAGAMMHASLVRARMLELLGRGLVDASELDNLFIVGAFSLLDVLLGVPLANALEPMHLPETIADALLYQIGPYAELYRLALACEDAATAGEIEALSAPLGLSTEQVNAALLQAVAFATNLGG